MKPITEIINSLSGNESWNNIKGKISFRALQTFDIQCRNKLFPLTHQVRYQVGNQIRENFRRKT